MPNANKITHLPRPIRTQSTHVRHLDGIAEINEQKGSHSNPSTEGSSPNLSRPDYGPQVKRLRLITAACAMPTPGDVLWAVILGGELMGQAPCFPETAE